MSEPCPDMAFKDAQPPRAGGPFRSDARWRRPETPVSGNWAICGDGQGAGGAEQLEALRSYVSERSVPVRLSTEDIGSFQARVQSTSLGAVQSFDVWSRNAIVVSRTNNLISSTDPDYLKVSVQIRGGCVVSQGDQQAMLRPGDFVLYDTTRPYRINASDSVLVRNLMFSRDALRLSPAQLQRLMSRPISGSTRRK